MGKAPIRITRDEFVTPPELRDFQLAGNAVGRVGGVRLELLSDAHGAHFGNCYQQIPLRVSQPFCFGNSTTALVYLINPTEGLLDGDCQLIELTLRPGAKAVVVGQSATRIHPALEGFATQQWRIRIGAGAALTLLPGPSIPFQGCRYYQRIVADLDAGAQLCLGDIWLAGRYARGKMSERFQFDTIVQDIRVYRESRLIFRDRFCWKGPWNKSAADWHFGNEIACASCFTTGSASEQLLRHDQRVQRAFFPTAAGDTVMRWRGPSECVTSAMTQSLTVISWNDLDWLGTDELARCHWFTTCSG